MYQNVNKNLVKRLKAKTTILRNKKAPNIDKFSSIIMKTTGWDTNCLPPNSYANYSLNDQRKEAEKVISKKSIEILGTNSINIIENEEKDKSKSNETNEKLSKTQTISINKTTSFDNFIDYGKPIDLKEDTMSLLTDKMQRIDKEKPSIDLQNESENFQPNSINEKDNAQKSLIDKLCCLYQKDPTIFELITENGIEPFIRQVFKVKYEYETLILKILNFDENQKSYKNGRANILHEYEMLSKLSKITKYCVKQRGIKITKPVNGRGKIFICMEYWGRSLDEEKLCDKKQLIEVIYQIVEVETFLESIGVSHLDLKPGNILYDRNSGKIKVIDMASTLDFCYNPKGIFCPIDKVNLYTPLYAPPCIKTQSNCIPQKIDCFCCGMTIANLILGFYGIEFDRVFSNNKAEHELFMIKLLVKLFNLSENHWIGLINKCLEFCPQSRPKFSEIKTMLIEIIQNNNLHDIDDLKKYDINISEKNLAKIFDMFVDFRAVARIMEYKYIRKLLRGSYDFYNSYAIAAKAYGELRKQKKIVKLFKRMTKGYKAWKMSTIEKAEFYRAKGTMFLYLGKHNESVKNYKKSLLIIKNLKRKDKLKLCELYDNLLVAHWLNKQYEIAVSYGKKAKSLALKLYKNLHHRVSDIFEHLGLLYYCLNSIEKSTKYFHKSLEIRSNLFGEYSKQVGKSLDMLANFYYCQGMYEKAISYRLDSKFIAEFNYGRNSSQYLRALTNNSMEFVRLGNKEKAEEELREIEKIAPSFFKICPAAYFSYFYHCLGQICFKRGKHIETTECIKRVHLSIYELIESEHPNITFTYNWWNISFNIVKSLYEVLKNQHILLNYRMNWHRNNNSNSKSAYTELNDIIGKIWKNDKVAKYFLMAIINYMEYKESKEIEHVRYIIKSLYEIPIKDTVCIDGFINSMIEGLKENHQEIGPLYAILAFIYFNLNQVDKSINYYNHTVNSFEKIKEEESQWIISLIETEKEIVENNLKLKRENKN